MIPARIIARKRDGHELTDAEISFFIQEFTGERIADYQMSALAMAIFLNGMSERETATLTQQMLDSGARLNWPGFHKPCVDKHSTGGVGDKVSIPLAPLLVCCGLQVPMLSGRGLGATGGTLDKMEAIRGFRTDLSLSEIERLTTEVGCVITGASAELAPADRKLYALRDVTATVPSIPLITASIMSKKLAESLDALVLDVKFGSGAFMKTRALAEQLAQSLVSTGARMGVKTTALLTDMNQPLGRKCGNALEIQESIEILKGEGPSDVRQLTIELAAELLVSTKIKDSLGAARQLAVTQLDSGRAWEKFSQMVTAQGGNLNVQMDISPRHEFTAPRSGVVEAIDTEELGLAIIAMGGGRRQMDDRLDHSTGLEMLVKVGDSVKAGQPLVCLYTNAPAEPVEMVRGALRISDSADSLPLVNGRFESFAS